MSSILTFLANNPILAICICLTLGYIVGTVRIKSFTVGATIGTLLVGFLLSRFVSFEIPGILVSLFSLLFCFTIGYEAGPAFFKSLKSNGIKYVIQTVFFCGVAFLCLYLLGATNLLDRDSILGMAAGALTQTSILTTANDLGSNASVVYAVTYIFGMVGAILMVSVIGPFLLRTDLPSAVKQKLAKSKTAAITSAESEDVRVSPVYPRTYRVANGSSYIGQTIEDLEDRFTHSLQVVKLFRDGKEMAFLQETVVAAGDILTVISPTQYLVAVDDEYLIEIADPQYASLELITKEIVVTESPDGQAIDVLSRFGVVLQTMTVKGKKVLVNESTKIVKGAVIKVSGVAASIRKAADQLGYLKETGHATDVPFLFIALAAAIILGAIKFGNYAFGDSTFALLLGLICGWYNNRQPKYGKFPESARWFLKSVGLNLFIAVKALTTGFFVFDKTMLAIIGIGFAVTLLPHIITLLFCRYLMKMDTADILGGLCGSGTCSAALNTLTDATGSSVFTSSFATTNAVSNILLTVVGVILSSVL